MRFILLFFGIASLLSAVSCSSEPEPKSRKLHSGVQYPKLKDYSLNLSIVSSRKEYYAGEENARITFSLKNTGLTPVTLNEWYMNESVNIRLYYAPGTLAETARLAPDQWKISPTFDPKKKRITQRSPLVLNPDTNHALVMAPLTFLRELKDGGTRRPYTIRGELNLQSVDVKSAPFEILVK